MARVGKEAHGAWIKKKGARVMDFVHRPMMGYLFVDAKGLEGKNLSEWVENCWEHAGTLPAKEKKKKRK
jgi:hypothetical protein